MKREPELEPDRQPEEVARVLLDMKPKNWVTLIATVSVTEILALAREYLQRRGKAPV